MMKSLQRTKDASEINFLANNDHVAIVRTRNLEKMIKFISTL